MNSSVRIQFIFSSKGLQAMNTAVGLVSGMNFPVFNQTRLLSEGLLAMIASKGFLTCNSFYLFSSLFVFQVYLQSQMTSEIPLME